MKYTEKYQIGFNECDENQHLKLPSMVDLLMKVSEDQLDAGRAGTEALMERGLGWVVTQYHFEIKNLPRPMDKVILSTEASGYNRFFEYRDFGISDQQGNELVKVTSQWVMFDLKARKLIPCDEELMKQFKVPLLPKMPHFSRLRALKQYDQSRKYRVRYDDLDTNHHLTNSHYFNWFIDMMDRDFLRKHLVSQIDIKFDQEVRYGEQPLSLMSLKEDKNDLMSYHAIEDDTGKVRTVCELKWRSI
ncbi:MULTISPECIES: acyl-[acyl-carrier-protein] thioesterase [Lactobacillus]|uniref:Acyl-[acyl-carrier-protein] thioesterase n=1 Tax=Lactobacillus xujianguonis TaxID=2495899 RepID=A0A437SWW4_9LACO|nr:MULTISPECIES: acyl-ACP thioesterase domain-containing protein [Lactobacillus]RVU71392.1 acyl-[acyl-carrier-protein] thioesterase [Lactobacillus xujianguonis]RVU76947.1 acyl-[acyl-carrier-protein] thioesterase [Lactobacillus xujianguonis]